MLTALQFSMQGRYGEVNTTLTTTENTIGLNTGIENLRWRDLVHFRVRENAALRGGKTLLSSPATSPGLSIHGPRVHG